MSGSFKRDRVKSITPIGTRVIFEPVDTSRVARMYAMMQWREFASNTTAVHVSRSVTNPVLYIPR